MNNEWIGRGYFTKLDGLPGLENFDDTAKAAWSTRRLDLLRAGRRGARRLLLQRGHLQGAWPRPSRPRRTSSSPCCKKIKDNGKYAPLAYGSAESWQLAYNGLYSIGPAYWKGEEGRLGLIDGTKKLTDPEFVAAFKAFADWKPFLPSGYQSLAYADMTQLFTLGKAAILPDGSWNINQVTSTGLNVGVFGAAGRQGR